MHIAPRRTLQLIVYSTRAPGARPLRLPWVQNFTTVIFLDHAVDRLRLAVVSAVRQADRKRVTALCTEAFEHLQKQRSAQADLDVPEHLAHDTEIPFRFCAPPPPGLLQYTSHSRSVSMIVLTVTVKSSSVCSHHEDDSPCTFLGMSLGFGRLTVCRKRSTRTR